MDLHTYEATLPTVPTGTDIASQHLVVTVDGAEQSTQELGIDATTATFTVPENSTVKLTLDYHDNAGNESGKAEQEFVAIDTIPPDAPGPFGEIKLVSERTVPDA